MLPLPIELIEQILVHLPFEKIISLSDRVSHQLFDPEIHTWHKAALDGNLDMIKWLHTHEKVWAEYFVDLAVENNHLDIIKYLCANDIDWPTSCSIELAAAKGHIEMVKWLHENCSDCYINRAVNFVIRWCHIDAFKLLYEHGIVCTIDAMYHASKYSKYDIVEWLYKKHIEDCTIYKMSWRDD